MLHWQAFVHLQRFSIMFISLYNSIDLPMNEHDTKFLIGATSSSILVKMSPFLVVISDERSPGLRKCIKLLLVRCPRSCWPPGNHLLYKELATCCLVMAYVDLFASILERICQLVHAITQFTQPLSNSLARTEMGPQERSEAKILH